MSLELLVRVCPIGVAILYTIIAVGYMLKKEFAWSCVYISYAIANIGLVMAAGGASK